MDQDQNKGESIEKEELLMKTSDKCPKCGKARMTDPAKQDCNEQDCPFSKK